MDSPTDLLARSWLLVGRDDEIPGPGHYFTWERTGIPLLVIRSADGEVRAFYNSCRHRGAPVVREERGRNRALRCQYHSWTYDTFGRLVSVPDERDFVDLRIEDRPLIEIAATVKGGWVLLNQDREAAAPVMEVPGEGFRLLTTIIVPSPAAPENVATILERLGPGAARSAAANAAFAAGASEILALSAWPGAAGCELVLHVTVPAWDEEEDSPIETDSWQRRLGDLRTALEDIAASQ